MCGAERKCGVVPTCWRKSWGMKQDFYQWDLIGWLNIGKKNLGNGNNGQPAENSRSGSPHLVQPPG